MKQRFIINQDLHMTKGKIAVQVAHGAIYYMSKIMGEAVGKTNTEYLNQIGKELNYKERIPISKTAKISIENYANWFSLHMKKVVLKATEQEMVEIEEQLNQTGIWSYKVYDLGLTQVPANSFTCLVIEPLETKSYPIKTIDRPNNVHDKLNSLKLL